MGKFFTKNLGPEHSEFNKNYPGFTQVQVIKKLPKGDYVVAQFFGMTAKILAAKFISSFDKQ